MKTDYNIKRGASLILTLTTIDGEIPEGTLASAKMKRAGTNGSVPGPTTAVTATLNVEGIVGGWKFSLTDEQTAIIDPGLYVIDAKLDLPDGAVSKTQHILLEIKPSVS